MAEAVAQDEEALEQLSGAIAHFPVAPHIDAEGVAFVNTWDCWRERSGTVRWNGWAFLPLLLPGVNTTARNFRLLKQAKRRFGNVFEAIEATGDPASNFWLPPLRSLSATGQDATDDAHISPTFSTRGLLVLLPAAAHLRTLTTDRAAGQRVWAAWWSMLSPELRVDDLDLASFVADPPPPCDGVVENGVCEHALEILAPPVGEIPVQDYVLRFLAGAVAKAPQCAHVALLLKRLTETLAQVFEETFQERSFSTDVVQGHVKRRGKTRLRHCNEDYKSLVRRRAVDLTVTAGTLDAAISGRRRNSTHRWGVEDNPAWLIRLQEDFRDVRVLSIACDAGRMGMPKEETMLYAISDGFVNAWLPIQVRGLICFRVGLVVPGNAHRGSAESDYFYEVRNTFSEISEMCAFF